MGISWGPLSWGMLLKGPGRAAGRAGPPVLLHLKALGLQETPVLQIAQAPRSSQGVLGAAPQQPGEIGTQPLLHKQFPDTRVFSNSELQLTPNPQRALGGLIRANHQCSLVKGQPSTRLGKVPGCCPSVEGGKLCSPECQEHSVLRALGEPTRGRFSIHQGAAVQRSGSRVPAPGTQTAQQPDLGIFLVLASLKASRCCREPGTGGGGGGESRGWLQAARVAGATRLTWVSPW